MGYYQTRGTDGNQGHWTTVIQLWCRTMSKPHLTHSYYWQSAIIIETGSSKKSYSRVINPFTLREARRGLTILEIFPLQKHFLKAFEWEMLIRRQTTNLFQIFCEISLHSQVIFISMKVADDISRGTLECEWVKIDLLFIKKIMFYNLSSFLDLFAHEEMFPIF